MQTSYLLGTRDSRSQALTGCACWTTASAKPWTSTCRCAITSRITPSADGLAPGCCLLRRCLFRLRRDSLGRSLPGSCLLCYRLLYRHLLRSRLRSSFLCWGFLLRRTQCPLDGSDALRPPTVRLHQAIDLLQQKTRVHWFHQHPIGAHLLPVLVGQGEGRKQGHRWPVRR